MRLRIVFFFPYPNRPREATISSPSPSYKKGGRLEGETRVGRGADLWREEVQTLGGEGPELGAAKHSRACYPSRALCWQPGEHNRLWGFLENSKATLEECL